MQLPSVTVDDVVEDSTGVFVGNRNPEPDELQVSPSTTIEFDCFEHTNALAVFVDELQVVAGSQLLNGWTGAVTALPGGAGVHVSLKPPSPFIVDTYVVVVASSGSEHAQWTFATYDFMPPLIQLAKPIDKATVEVVFTEPVFMGTSDSATGALNPARYTIEHVSRPAANPPVARVEYVAPNVVRLITEFECSFGAHYMLVIADVEDLAGNKFLAPANVFEFYGWSPPFPAGRRWVLHDFVPRMSLGEDSSDALRLLLGVLQDTNNILLESIDRWLEIIDPDVAPEAFVDAMLVDLGNPFSFELQLTDKRKLIKTLVLMYKLKGTTVGLISVVRFFLGIEVTCETFVGRGWRLGFDQLSTTSRVAPTPAVIGPGSRALYSFRVHTLATLSDTTRSQIEMICRYMKGAQEHFVGIRDATYVATSREYWTVGYPRIGFCKVSDSVTPSGPAIFGFQGAAA